MSVTIETCPRHRAGREDRMISSLGVGPATAQGRFRTGFERGTGNLELFPSSASPKRSALIIKVGGCGRGERSTHLFYQGLFKVKEPRKECLVRKLILEDSAQTELVPRPREHRGSWEKRSPGASRCCSLTRWRAIPNTAPMIPGKEVGVVGVCPPPSPPPCQRRALHTPQG